MNEEFGVITITDNGNKVVVFYGSKEELDGTIDIIRENISDTAEIKMIDEDTYNNCKNNIKELNKILE